MEDWRTWRPVGRNVCMRCVADEGLARAITAAASETKCDYCNIESPGQAVAISVDDLLEIILDSISFEYEDPIEQVAWDEGEYVLPTMDSFELLDELEITDGGDLYSDLADALVDRIWVRKDPWRPSPFEALRWGWEEFRNHVMHKRRFTFLLPNGNSDSRRGSGEIPPEDMLGELARVIEGSGLVRVLPSGTELYRVRRHAEGDYPELATEIGPPPAGNAKANRMTPAGISGFYGASTAATAIAEVRAYADEDDYLTVGTFVTAKRFVIVDHVDLPVVPSLFDEMMRNLRGPINFLRSFAEDAAKGARPDDHEHIEYVPTQIVAEYLRDRLGHSDGPIMGVRWRSSKDHAQTSIVLFIESRECSDEPFDPDVNGDAALILRRGSVQRLAPSDWMSNAG